MNRVCVICNEEINMDNIINECCLDRAKAYMTYDFMTNEEKYYHVKCYDKRGKNENN